MHSTKSRKVPDRRKYCESDSYFSLDESSLRCVFHQITNLILVNNDKHESLRASTEYTRNVYAHIVNCFKNLKYLNIVRPDITIYPGLSLCNLPSNTFHFSILTDLHINVETFVDCLHLLDGRLKQLTTLNVIVHSIDKSSAIVRNMVNLH
jgi:hypothetical protein